MRSKVYVYFLLGVFWMAGCKKASSPNNENEHAAINGVELIFTQDGNLVGAFIAEDPDGDGGAPPSRIDTIKLPLSVKPYQAQIIVKNISNGVVKELNAKIQEQGTSHEFYYLSEGLNMSINKKDKDANGYPLGFLTDWQTNTAGDGNVIIKLMHKTLIKGPNDSPTKGHSDIEIIFPVKIQ
jgi:hypothetical protein